MQSKPETFEEHATRCERLAVETKRYDLMVLYRDCARQWREMAEQLREVQRLDDLISTARRERSGSG